MSTFDVTRPTDTVRLDEDGRAPVSFTVTNLSAAAIGAHLMVVPENAADAGVFTIEGGADRMLQPQETNTVRVLIVAKADTAPGRHGFALKVVDSERSDDIFATSQRVEFIAAAPVEQTWKHWWLIPVAVLLAIAVGGVWYWSRRPPPAPEELRLTNIGVFSSEERPLVFDKPLIVLCDTFVSSASLLPILERALNPNAPRRPLVVLSDVDRSVLPTLKSAPPDLQWAIVYLAGDGEEKRRHRERIAAVSGAQLFANVTQLESATLQDLGRVPKISITDRYTAIERPGGGGPIPDGR